MSKFVVSLWDLELALPTRDFNPNHVASGEHGGEFTSSSGSVVAMTAQTRAMLVRPNLDKTIDQLRADAAQNQAILEELGARVEGELQIDFFPPPSIKTVESITRKVRDEGYSGPGELTDISRGSFTVDSPEQVDSVLRILQTKGTVYDKGWTKLEKSGYIDRKVFMQHPNGGISEIQFIPQGIAQMKEGEGHKLYEVMRLPSTPVAEREALAARSRELYKSVLPEAFKGLYGDR